MGEISHPIAPPLVSSLVGSDHILFFLPQAVTVQGSEVSPKTHKGETLEGLKWGGVGAEGT